MAWGKAEETAYQEGLERDPDRLVIPQTGPQREPLCTVRMGQACEFTVDPEQKCWYCLLTREQIAAGLTLGDVLEVGTHHGQRQ